METPAEIIKLLKLCASGKMPKVEHDKFGLGAVVTIKNGEDGRFGCAVNFVALPYNKWFHAKPSEDQRSNYMNELNYIPYEKS